MTELVVAGLCSWFVVSPSAAINPEPGSYYVACRWDYDAIAKDLGIPRKDVKRRLRSTLVKVRNPRTGITISAQIADWGPHERTGRAIDMSRGLMKDLMLETDQQAEVRIEW